MRLLQHSLENSQAKNPPLANFHKAHLNSLLWMKLRMAVVSGLASQCVSVAPQVEADRQLGSLTAMCEEGKEEAKDGHHAEMYAQFNVVQLIHKIRNGLKVAEAYKELQDDCITMLCRFPRPYSHSHNQLLYTLISFQLGMLANMSKDDEYVPTSQSHLCFRFESSKDAHTFLKQLILKDLGDLGVCLPPSSSICNIYHSHYAILAESLIHNVVLNNDELCSSGSDLGTARLLIEVVKQAEMLCTFSVNIPSALSKEVEQASSLLDFHLAADLQALSKAADKLLSVAVDSLSRRDSFWFLQHAFSSLALAYAAAHTESLYSTSHRKQSREIGTVRRKISTLIRAVVKIRECMNKLLHFHTTDSKPISQTQRSSLPSAVLAELCGSTSTRTVDFSDPSGYVPVKSMPGAVPPLKPSSSHSSSNEITWLRLVKYSEQLHRDIVPLCATNPSGVRCMVYRFCASSRMKLLSMDLYLKANYQLYRNSCSLELSWEKDLKATAGLASAEVDAGRVFAAKAIGDKVAVGEGSGQKTPSRKASRGLDVNSRAGQRSSLTKDAKQMKPGANVAFQLFWWQPASCPFFSLSQRSKCCSWKLMDALGGEQQQSHGIKDIDNSVVLFYSANPMGQKPVSKDDKETLVGCRVLPMDAIAHIQEKLNSASFASFRAKQTTGGIQDQTGLSDVQETTGVKTELKQAMDDILSLLNLEEAPALLSSVSFKSPLEAATSLKTCFDILQGGRVEQQEVATWLYCILSYCKET